MATLEDVEHPVQDKGRIDSLHLKDQQSRLDIYYLNRIQREMITCLVVVPIP